MDTNFVNRKNLPEGQRHLLAVCSSKPFLNNEGLNNEVPFHICPFDPSIADDMTHAIRQLKNELRGASVSVLEINLFDLVLDILRSEGDLDWFLDNESEFDRNRLKAELQGILDVETIIVPRIDDEMSKAVFDLMFITGVGEVYPYIRSHNILNNLQRVAKKQPTVLFYPGSYQHSLEKGASLRLFNVLMDDKYYRAFNILDRAI
ncbi:MAG: DUF1788 domain-containing protein [Betaproteobacteria bacterium]